MNDYLTINEKIDFLNKKIQLTLIEIEYCEKVILDPTIAPKDESISNDVILSEFNEYLFKLKQKKELYVSLIDNLKQ
jgi:hypothetical protein